MDSSKFGARKLVKAASVTEFDEILTAEGVDDAAAAQFAVLVRRAAGEGERPVLL